jgi:hypothetical protein
MPYIKKELRDKLGFSVLTERPKNVGELNYYLTMIIQDYLPEDPHYEDYNDVLGVLTCMIQEIYRRKVAPYEDKKIIENGDVF